MSNAFRTSQIVGTIFLGVLPFAAAGCGDGRPDTFPVTGTVVYQGRPLEGATVMFIPEKTHSASGITDAQGRFTLLSFSPDDGAVVGQHTVSVAKYSHDSKEPMHSMKPAKVQLAVPPKYASPVTSPLRVTVTKDGPNDFRLELKD